MHKYHQSLKRLAVVFAIVVCMPSIAKATVLATFVNPTNGHTYHLLDATTWTASEAEAVTLDGHLVTIDDAAENVWVEATFKPFGNKFWLGFTDVVAEGNFVWIDGSPVTFVNWGGIEPNDACPFGPEDVAIMYTNGEGLVGPNPIQDGEWADIPDNVACGGGSPVRGVVELFPPSSAPGLTMVGLTCLSLLVFSLGAWMMRTNDLRFTNQVKRMIAS